MKKLVAILLCVMLIFATALPAMALKTNTANKATIVIDGKKDDAYGDKYFVVDGGMAPTEADPYDPNSATAHVWLAWDDNYIYLYAEVYDKTPNHGNGDIYPIGRGDNFEIMIDWNSGKGILDQGKADGTPTDEGDTPYWQVRFFPTPYEGTAVGSDGMDWNGKQPVLGCYTKGEPGNSSNWSTFGYVGPDDMFYEDKVDFVTLPLNGTNFRDGYIVEAKIKAPEVAKLTQGKVIGVDFHVFDNIKGENSRDGRKFLEASENLPNIWGSPGYFNGELTLGAAYVAPTTPGTGGTGTDAGTTPTTRPPAPPMGDNGIVLIAIMFAAALAAVVVLRKKAVK